MSSESSAQKGGRFSFRLAPWQREVVDAPDEKGVRSVVCMWASQTTGKTETVNNIILHKIDIDPGPFLVIEPTLEMGETWSKDRLTPAVRDSPRIRDKVGDSRTRDSGNTILHKTFPGGHITVAGANSPSSLASRPIRMVIFDEVDRYPFSAGSEGDPIAIAEKRTESFHDAVTIKVSTPLIKGTSRIEKAFLDSDKRYWFCPCPHCSFSQTLVWSQMRWHSDDFTTARYHCENCDKPWTPEERKKAIQAGEWRATSASKGIRGYHLNGIYCLFRPSKGFSTREEEMVSKFLKAKHAGKEEFQVWWNTFLAETWEDEAESAPQIDRLLARVEEYPTEHLPAGVLMLTVTGDVQGDRIESQIDGWGIGEERWLIKRIVIPGNPELDFVWEELDKFLSQTFKLAGGQVPSIASGLVDRRHKGKAVDAFTKKNNYRFIFSCQGGTTELLPVVSGPKKSGVTKAFVYTIGTYEAKRIIYSRLQNDNPGPRYMHFPVGTDERYFRSLVSERLVTEYTKRGPKKIWKKIHDRNEGLDLAVYGLAAMMARRPDFELIAKNLAKSAVAEKVESVAESKTETQTPKPLHEPPKPTPQPTNFRIGRSGGNFIGRWKR